METRVDSEFDRALRLAERSCTPGVYDADLDEGWWIGGALHGGYLMALCARALGLRLPEHPDPLTVGAFFLSGGRPGPATVATEVVRRGRSLSHGAAVLSQQDDEGRRERLRITAAFHDQGADGGEYVCSPPPAPMPPPDECPPMPRHLERTDLFDRIDLRIDPDTLGWHRGEPSRRGEVRGWVRLADGRDPDPLMLLVALDALPPVTLDFGLDGYAPTIELTAHLRARPVPGWIRVRHATRALAGGYVEEDAEAWDESGRLVAQSRQLVRVPRA